MLPMAVQLDVQLAESQPGFDPSLKHLVCPVTLNCDTTKISGGHAYILYIYIYMCVCAPESPKSICQTPNKTKFGHHNSHELFKLSVGLEYTDSLLCQSMALLQKKVSFSMTQNSLVRLQFRSSVVYRISPMIRI